MRNSLTRQVASPLLGLPRGSFPVKIRIFSIRRQLCRRNYHTNSDIRYSNDQLRCKVVHNHGIRHSSAHPRILAFVKSLNSPFSSTAPSFAPSTNKPGLGSFSGSGSGFGNIADTPPTDFAALDVLGDLQGPAAGVEVITSDGFKLSNGIRIAGAGVMLIGGEAFKWRPWLAKGGDEDGDKNAGAKADMALLKNARGQWEVHESCWGLLDLVWPKPDLLILGTGQDIMPLAPQTRAHINELGIRIEILDTRNAAAQYMLLATERGIEQVAAALVPLS